MTYVSSSNYIITASVVFVFGTIFADLEIPLTVLCLLQPGLCLGNSWDSNNFKNMITIWHMIVKFKTGTRRDAFVYPQLLGSDRENELDMTWETLYKSVRTKWKLIGERWAGYTSNKTDNYHWVLTAPCTNPVARTSETGSCLSTNHFQNQRLEGLLIRI